jgi:3-oxoadipate enol-lactonase
MARNGGISGEYGKRGQLMEVKTNEAEINGINIHYRVYGEGEPLLLIMGLSANADWWGEQFLKPLAENFQVVTFDNRGSGRSGKPEGPYPVPLMAEDTMGLMDHLGWESANIAGASMGGMIAQEIALEHPERVRRLVLMCTFCGGKEAVQASPEVLALLNMPREGLGERNLIKASLPILFPQDYIDENPALMEAIVDVFMIAPIPPKCFIWQVMGINMWSSHPRLGGLRHPTLIITGTEDILIPAENSRILAEAIPNSRLVEYPGAGHGIETMCGKEIPQEIISFLKE